MRPGNRSKAGRSGNQSHDRIRHYDEECYRRSPFHASERDRSAAPEEQNQRSTCGR